MRILIIISLSLFLTLLTSASYAVNGGIDTTQAKAVCGPIPIGKALSTFLKPYIKQTVQQLVKRGIVNKATGKQISKTLIGCTTATSLCQLAKQQLSTENILSKTALGAQKGYETFILPKEISMQVKSNMQDYLHKFKEEHQIE